MALERSQEEPVFLLIGEPKILRHRIVDMLVQAGLEQVLADGSPRRALLVRAKPPPPWDLPAQTRGRGLYRLTLYQAFDEESDHSEGVFIFGGWTFVWHIGEFAGERSISLMLATDL